MLVVIAGAEALPERMHFSMPSANNSGHAIRDPKCTHRTIENLSRCLESNHPGAAASLREGLTETVSVMRLDLPRSLDRVLR